jgi:hypothetical protein
MLKKLLLGVLVGFYPYYCYSDNIAPYYGTTGNAAQSGHSWSMKDVLPAPPGLDINGVFYRYTANKNPEDDMKVHVQNKNANGTGYVFRDTEDWSGAPGGIEVRKVIGIGDIPREAWGDGSIEVEGTGTVDDASVIYSYKVDPCYDPQFSPSCPGYKTPVPVVPTVNLDDLYDATKDEYVNLNAEEKLSIEENEERLSEKEEEEKEAEEEKKRKYRLEKLMSVADAAALFAENQVIEQMNNIMQNQINNTYLTATIPGGQYKETIVLVDTKLPENKAGLRNGLAQQILHEKMVSQQYK